MSQPTVTAYPLSTLRQGDTWAWLRSLPDYPASVWALTARLVSAAASHSAAATAAGGDHQVKFGAVITSAIAAGDYTLIETVTDGTDRYTIGQGRITVLPDPASATPTDMRGPMRRAYDAALSALAAHVESGHWRVLELRIADRATKFNTPAELQAQITWLRNLAEAEDAARAGTVRTHRPGTTLGISFGTQA